MKKIVLLALLLVPLSGFAQSNNVQKYVKNVLQKDSLFQNAVVGIYAEDNNGKCVAQWNPDLPLLTASTMKTITTGAAISILGKDFRYETSIGYTGEIQDSLLNGDIWIIGGGDPTLGSTFPNAIPIEEVFGAWKSALDSLGIEAINGRIIADDTYLTDEMIPDSWTWGNIGYYYGSGASGLCYYENTQDFFVAPSDTIGLPAILKAVYPEVPGLEIRTLINTGDSSSRYSTWCYLQNMAPITELHGNLPYTRGEVKRNYSNKYPHLGCAKEFEKYLTNHGVVCNTTIEDVDNVETPAADSLCIIKTTYSPTMDIIIDETNLVSNNLFAENLFKSLGKEITGVGSYDSARVVLNNWLTEQGVDLLGYTQDDGSGLSRENYVSPRFFTKYYKMMMKSDTFAEYLASFPVPGKPRGTLKNVLKEESEEVKQRIHAKSGSLSCVKCYAGYVDCAQGPIRFAILVNNGSTSKMQAQIEGFMKELSVYAGKKK